MGCSDISLNRWLVARETLSTATYNKIQYKVWGIIQLRRGWGAAGQAQAKDWERCGNIQCPNRNSWEQEPQKDVLTVQCLEGKGGKDIPDVCKKKKYFYCFLVNIFKKEEFELKLKLHTVYGTTTGQSGQVYHCSQTLRATWHNNLNN